MAVASGRPPLYQLYQRGRLLTIRSLLKSAPEPHSRRPGEILREAKAHDRAGRLDHALAGYDEVIRVTDTSGERTILIEALRRLAVVHHLRNARELASKLCQRSYEVADATGDRLQAGEALNALGRFDVEAGEMPAARRHFQRALALAGKNDDLRGRIEQNLGIIASVQGDHDTAVSHFGRSLEAFESTENVHDGAQAWHGMALVDWARGEADLALTRLTKSAELARSLGDIHLEGRCHLGQAEVAHGRQQFAAAKSSVLRALEIFELLDVPIDRSAAHRVLGMVYRETGKHREAAHQFRRAVHLAEETRWILGEGLALREMAHLNEQSGGRTEAVTLLTVAYGLFAQLEARLEVADVSRRLTELAAA